MNNNKDISTFGHKLDFCKKLPITARLLFQYVLIILSLCLILLCFGHYFYHNCIK